MNKREGKGRSFLVLKNEKEHFKINDAWVVLAKIQRIPVYKGKITSKLCDGQDLPAVLARASSMPEVAL